MSRKTALFTTVILLWTVPLLAQDDPKAQIKVSSTLAKTDGEYRLGPGDLVEIGVFGVENFRHTVRISASGVIKLPLLDPIVASGLTPAELEARVASALQDEIIKNPQVSVFVKEYRSQPVFVLGSVKAPGQYQISLELKIIDAISMAGGLLPTAGAEATIRRQTSDGREEHITVNLQQLLEKGDFSVNERIRGGDVINIPERVAETVYILGEVNRAGAFTIPPKQDIRVSQLFAWAGGPMKSAKLSRGILVRYNDKGEREEVPVDFSAIIKGKKEDFVVRADDIVFVPGSKWKDLGMTILNGIPGTLATLPYRIP